MSPAGIEGFENDTIDWLALKDDYSLIRNKIEAVIPGFESFNKKVLLH